VGVVDDVRLDQSSECRVIAGCEGCNELAQGDAPFPERSAVTSVGARFLVDFYELVDRWAAWATEVVQDWPENPDEAGPTLDVDRYILERAGRWQSESREDGVVEEFTPVDHS
jgi:hypothetical protein